MTAPTPPAPAVLAAFGLRDQPQHLKGGISQTVWRVGDVVLKPVQEPNPGEGDWVANVLDAVEERGFRVVKPVRSTDGRWLFNGWTAWHWIEADRCRSDWSKVINASRVLHAELPQAIARAGCDVRPSWLDRRQHRWARAERTVWHGAALPPTINTNALEWSLFERAITLGPPLTAGEEHHAQVVHGDVAGNMLVDPVSVLAFIDFSPGWRTVASVDAQVAVEAVAWFRADHAILDGLDPADLARACGFRLLCGLQASADWATEFPGETEAWTAVLDAIGA